MSDDLIKRSDAIKDLCDISNNSDMPNDWHRGLSVAISALYRVSSADSLQDDEFKNFDRESLILLIEVQKERIGELLADRPQGEWIKHDEERDYCSRCNHIFKTRTIAKQDKWTNYIDDLGFNYCPNCGAKMKGADDE